MWKPRKFKSIYLMATLYVFTLTLPSASAVYWAFGDQLLNHSNAFSLLPKTRFRDAAVILMLIHQVPILTLICYYTGCLTIIPLCINDWSNSMPLIYTGTHYTLRTFILSFFLSQ